MKKICTLRKAFNDGGRTTVEFVEVSASKHREIRREMLFDGSLNLSIQNNLSREQIDRDIALYMEQGYKKF